MDQIQNILVHQHLRTRTRNVRVPVGYSHVVGPTSIRAVQHKERSHLQDHQLCPAAGNLTHHHLFLRDLILNRIARNRRCRQFATNVTGDVKAGEQVAVMEGYFTEPLFFRIFDFELVNGNKGTALSNARSIIITTDIAKKLFGNEDPIGETVEFFNRQLAFPLENDDTGSAPIPWGSFTVTGVIDASGYKSHLKFDVLMSNATMPSLIGRKENQRPHETTGIGFSGLTHLSFSATMPRLLISKQP